MHKIGIRTRSAALTISAQRCVALKWPSLSVVKLSHWAVAKAQVSPTVSFKMTQSLEA
jgi:hypothetical protein